MSAAPAAPDEPLAESAPLALSWAEQLCRPAEAGGASCAWYHGAWQYLRLLGVITGICAEAPFFGQTFGRLVRTKGFQRVLIAGAADYGMLAQLLAACRAAAVSPRIVVLDRCPTPLQLNRWYAEREGVEVDLHEGDLFDFEPEAPFDLICTHSFFSFVPPERHLDLVRRWENLLREGGWLVSSQSVRRGYTGDQVQFGPDQAVVFGEKVARAARARGGIPGIACETLGEIGRRFGQHKGGFPIRSGEELRGAFEARGFEMESFAPADERTHALHRPAAPDDRGSWQRFQICAAKSSPPAEA